jgi:uncharacterized MAPEG superfamily protein
MGTEMQMLMWATLLGLAQLASYATANTMQRGFAWGVGARDCEPPAVSPLAQRLERAFKNFIETYGFFAVAVLLLHATGKGNAQSALGAQLYFWARVAYVPAYAIGAPFVRTLVWAAALAGLVLVLLQVPLA